MSGWRSSAATEVVGGKSEVLYGVSRVCRRTQIFGSHPVIKGVSVDIEDGEFVILVGPSGCGKSTLLRMLAGLEHITAGEIRIGDRVVNDLRPKERDIAMVFQNYALYPHMTVADNMSFSLMLAGVPKAEIQERVKPAAEILGLSNLSSAIRDSFQVVSGSEWPGDAPSCATPGFLFDEPLSNSTPSCASPCAQRSESASKADDHDRLRYPRSDRGDDDGRQDRRHERRVVEQIGAPSISMTNRPIFSSPASSAPRP